MAHLRAKTKSNTNTVPHKHQNLSFVHNESSVSILLYAVNALLQNVDRMCTYSVQLLASEYHDVAPMTPAI